MQRRSRHSRGYAATLAVVATLALGATPTASGDDWARDRAAVAGLVAGVAAMCVLLGCVTLVRSNGRLRSV